MARPVLIAAGRSCIRVGRRLLRAKRDEKREHANFCFSTVGHSLAFPIIVRSLHDIERIKFT
jgi:hypothetical protein